MDIRKISFAKELVFAEADQRLDRPICRAAALVCCRNPFAGQGYVDDLSPLFDFGKEAGARVGADLATLLDGPACSYGKAALVVSVTPDLAGRVHAGQLVKELAPIIGGKGGGRPDFAQAGGRQPERIGELFAACSELLGRQLAEERTSNAGLRPA